MARVVRGARAETMMTDRAGLPEWDEPRVWERGNP